MDPPLLMDSLNDFTRLTTALGYGLVANPHVHEIMRCAGIRDLACNVRGSMNPMNVIKGTFEALATQKTPEDVARMRGKKVVDVRQAYYGAAA